MPAQHHLSFPLRDPSLLNNIIVGDEVIVSGIIVTSRDIAHKYYTEKINQDLITKEKLMPYLNQGAIYHCGPVVDVENRRIISAGPTTSIREEPYQDKVIEMFHLKAVIGKGGMGEKTLSSLVKNKALYLQAVGGAGSYYAKKLKLIDVFKLAEFGMPEAMWVFEVSDFYTIVTMDHHGNNIHKEIAENSLQKLKKIMI